MNKLLIALLVVFFATGCRTTKKTTESRVETSNKVEEVQKVDTKEEVRVDNDKTTYKKTTITETEYFALEKPRNEPKDSVQVNNPTETKSVVKTTKTTIIEEGTKDNSKTETVKTDNSETITESKVESKSDSKTIEKEKVPVRWGWVFGVLVILAVGFVYLKKSGKLSIVTVFFNKLFKTNQ